MSGYASLPQPSSLSQNKVDKGHHYGRQLYSVYAGKNVYIIMRSIVWYGGKTFKEGTP